jgi:hypothetical protein
MTIDETTAGPLAQLSLSRWLWPVQSALCAADECVGRTASRAAHSPQIETMSMPAFLALSATPDVCLDLVEQLLIQGVDYGSISSLPLSYRKDAVLIAPVAATRRDIQKAGLGRRLPHSSAVPSPPGPRRGG